ncbi:hypothetical protein C3374_14075 [Pantoea sp. PSNIH4]|nr:hypothetical protein PSNIH2_13335 [Pantoea sp. PSNIH2]POU49570.1 hypothetical protein C3380_08305 [Pantoea sp. PSNIH5]POU65581.1 hypothetical protein C3374_14075 [Pantoea sp. PSNIH4]POY65585.1 hypothetical protein C3402_22465 [Pantoea sp. PSNIH3]
MHPVVQLTISVALVVMAARMWPPLLFWLLGIMALLLIVKLVRRSARFIRSSITAAWFEPVLSFLVYTGMWLALAAVADYFFPARISAVSIVLCFAGAYAVIALIVVATGKLERN